MAKKPWEEDYSVKEEKNPWEEDYSSEFDTTRDVSRNRSPSATQDDTFTSLAPTSIDDSMIDYIGDTALHGLYGAAEGLTLGGRDEIVAGLESLYKGTKYKDELREQEELAKEIAKQSPIATKLGEFAGGVALPGMAAFKVAKAAQGASKLAKFANLLKQGAALAPAGAAMGGIQAVATSEKTIDEMTPEELATRAGSGALVGGAASIAAPAVITGGIGLAKGVTKLAGDAANVIPGVREYFQTAKPGLLRSIDIEDPNVPSNLRKSIIEEVKQPAQEAEELLRSTKIAPLEESLEKTSSELSQQFQQGFEKTARQIEEEQALLAVDFLNKLNSTGSGAGKLVTKIKKELMKMAPEARLKAIPNAIKNVEAKILDTEGLKSDPEVLRLVQDFKDRLSVVKNQPVTRTQTIKEVPGKPAVSKYTYKSAGEGTPEELARVFNKAPIVEKTGTELSVVGKGGKLPEPPIEDLRPTTSTPGAALEQPTPVSFTKKNVEVASFPEQYSEDLNIDKSFETLRRLQEQASGLKKKDPNQARIYAEEAYNAKTAMRDELSKVAGEPVIEEFSKNNDIYAAFASLKQNFGIDFKDPGDARTKLLAIAQNLQTEAAANPVAVSKVKEFIDSVSLVDPSLASSFKPMFEPLLKKQRSLPSVPEASKIGASLREAATAKSTYPLEDLKNIAKQVNMEYPEQAVKAGIETAESLVKAKDLLKDLDYKKMLQAMQNSDNMVNVKAYDDVKNFVRAIAEVNPERAKSIETNTKVLLEDLEAAALLQETPNEVLGYIRRAARVAGAKTGKLLAPATQVVRKVVNPAMDFVKGTLSNIERQAAADLAQGAAAAGKPTVATYLNSIASKDTQARNAALFMISQDKKARNDIQEYLKSQGIESTEE
jgi:hypothetical protein